MPNEAAVVVFPRDQSEKFGLLLGIEGKQLRVRWEDGTEEVVTSGPYLRAPFGSSQFLRTVLPDTWDAAWRSVGSATDVLALLVLEGVGPSTPAALKKRAAAAGVPALSSDVWAALRERPDLVWKNSKYAWAKGASAPDLVPPAWRDRFVRLLDAPPAIESDGAPVTSREEDSVASSAEQPVSRPEHADAPSHAGVERVPAPEKSRPSAPAPASYEEDPADAFSADTILAKLKRAKSQDDRASLLAELDTSEAPGVTRFVAHLVYSGTIDAGSAAVIGASPLELLQPLPIPATSIRSAIKALADDAREAALAAFVIAPNVLAKEQFGEWALTPTAVVQLERISSRLLQAELRAASLRRAVGAVGAACEALCRGAQRDSSVAPLAALHRTLELLVGNAEGRNAAETLVGAIADETRAIPASATGFHALRESVSNLPVSSGSARFRLLAALTTLESPGTEWIRDVPIDDLVGLPAADASRLLVVPAWREHLAGALAKDITAATTRQRVLRILSAPIAADLLPPSAGAEALARIGRSDAVVGAWLTQFSSENELTALRQERDQAVHQAEAAQLAAASAAEQNARLKQVIDDMQQRLDDSTRQIGVSQEAHVRQATRDAYRVVARILAAAEAESLRAAPAVLMTRLRQQARVAGIEPIGERGKPQPFNPALHEAPGGRPEPGTAVNVGRPGYLWVDDESTEVLIKALVSTA